MDNIVNIFIAIPFIGFLISLFVKESKEKALSVVSYATVGLHLIVASVFGVYWLIYGHPVLNVKEVVLYKSSGYEFFIDFYFDKITFTYLLFGSVLTFLVTIYSRYYLHREKGYKRFFNTVLFFYTGYNIVIFSGNLETMFIGWEILGIASFLLIAFYRNRYLPVRNAIKVFSIYRIGDVGIILAMWMSHHLFHENITFLKLNNDVLTHEHLQSHTLIGIFIAVMLLLSAAAKSAQLPFSYWLPRAMEGPTPSSAIFYGSLSVHIGAFLLLRTFSFWEFQTSVRILIAALGLLTSIVATLIARVQSSVKSQIAYSSIAQIGIIFIEIAAGLETIALVHIAGNAFLRTYQLLVSPSVVSYLIKEQFYNFVPRPLTFEDSWPKKLQNTFYILSLKEWNLDKLSYRIIWWPLHQIGKRLSFLNTKNLLFFFIPAYMAGIVLKYNEAIISENIHHYLPILFALIGLVMVSKAFEEKDNVFMAWTLIIMNHFWIALAVSFNESYSLEQNFIYLSGIVVAGVIGYLALVKLKAKEDVSLKQYHGHSYEHPKLALLFFMACLGLAGFPITPTFVGEDLIFTHIHENQIWLAVIASVSFVIDGLALVKIYAKVFLGQHQKSYHEVPYKSS